MQYIIQEARVAAEASLNEKMENHKKKRDEEMEEMLKKIQEHQEHVGKVMYILINNSQVPPLNSWKKISMGGGRGGVTKKKEKTSQKMFYVKKTGDMLCDMFSNIYNTKYIYLGVICIN